MIHSSADDTVVGDLVLIRWTDRAYALDHEPSPIPMESVGWITSTNNACVTIAQERDGQGASHRAYTAILRTNMREILRLRTLSE